MQLAQGVHDFNADHFGTLADLTSSTTEASRFQSGLIIACSDQGSALDNISFAEPGQFLIVQDLAASVPGLAEAGENAVLGSIQYAAGMMNVQDVVVCGHTGCGIIRRWISSRKRSSEMPTAQLGRETLRFIEANYPDAEGREKLDLCIREHILLQLENLQSHAFVRERLEEGRLRLHAWLVDDETARVRSYDPYTGSFTPIEAAFGRARA